ncbi:hypothetical protein LCGC14_2429640 [marine sediment metagenome]|uniref:Toprim domain-containing protein n=1 Tax=marine sediment metagenome TaxID=412755 RepID=A0A0F9BMD1_9ZZZZ
MSLEQLYIKYIIPIAEETERHYRPGWLNTVCPFCTGNPGQHLGYNLRGNYYACHRCGGHAVEYTLSKLLQMNRDKVKQLAKEYRIKSTTKQSQKQLAPTINLHPFKFPTGMTKMGKTQHRYLQGRGFDSHFLEKEFQLSCTGPVSKVDDFPYIFRIVAPILWEGQTISFQARDYTGKQEKRYLACPKARETIHHKHILYVNPKTIGETILCVEGITDVWRFRDKAAATFGIKYTSEQIRVLAKLYKRIFIAFDPEPEAQKQAQKLKSELSFRGVEMHNIMLDSDPGSMSQKKKNYLIKHLKL